MTLLTWNQSTGCYQANVNGDLVEVTGKAFIEAEQELRAVYEAEGMSKDAATGKAWDNLKDAEAWLQDPMDGLYINGHDRSE